MHELCMDNGNNKISITRILSYTTPMSSIQTAYQSAVSILVIFVMLVLPFLSMQASAHSFTMQGMTQTASQTAQGISHDCCDKPLLATLTSTVDDCCKQCQHNDQCQCDSGQLGSSVALTMSSVLPEAIPAIINYRAISFSLRAKINDSLHRPPILLFLI